MFDKYEHLSAYLRARFGATDRGASLVEYVLLVALIAVAAIVAMQLVGSKANHRLSEAGSQIS